MDRLLSEQEVIEAVNKHTVPSVEIILSEDITEILKEVPSAEPKWIPVSEKLPEKNVWVLVTVEQSGVRYQEIMRRNNYIETWTDNIDNYTDEITAWMPLPAPYKKESEVSE